MYNLNIKVKHEVLILPTSSEHTTTTLRRSAFCLLTIRKHEGELARRRQSSYRWQCQRQLVREYMEVKGGGGSRKTFMSNVARHKNAFS